MRQEKGYAHRDSGEGEEKESEREYARDERVSCRDRKKGEKFNGLAEPILH